jgi:hypothetical protein
MYKYSNVLCAVLAPMAVEGIYFAGFSTWGLMVHSNNDDHVMSRSGPKLGESSNVKVARCQKWARSGFLSTEHPKGFCEF